MTLDEAIEYIRRPNRASDGRPPSPGDLLIAEIDRLRAENAALKSQIEAVCSED